MIEWIRLEMEHEERKETSRLEKEHSILYYDPLYSRIFRSSENSILEEYCKVMERLGN